MSQQLSTIPTRHKPRYEFRYYVLDETKFVLELRRGRVWKTTRHPRPGLSLPTTRDEHKAVVKMYRTESKPTTAEKMRAVIDTNRAAGIERAYQRDLARLTQ